ncbi:dicarboxylate/amino acid:cation symporter [Desulfurivibrio alkaliphilus]|uniref:Sodium:dicarboxylate symporter n=1 Tax=Desulfurivibrio alkaliphilus (strain DSM 19089 / UNIQEM U267 / AHT2) TaxID=589865 RepID=D6Z0X0_DESAT|nr:dicarboxylate/amino acid:cation symporter [Desulfurivibrio alkaliphilus]ADH87230.1 sodium:dicarboxylate symporter [Desulfurivibrio alkaliphilus AHT 2]
MSVINDPLTVLQPRNLKYQAVRLHGFIRRRLWLQVLLAMFAGLAAGILLGPGGNVPPATARVITNWLALPGHVFLALIQMIVIPLVIASIIRGMAASEDMTHLRKLGVRVGLFFLATTVMAILIGIAAALLIKPGIYLDSAMVQAALGSAATALPTAPEGITLETLPGRIADFLPTNPLQAGLERDMAQVVLLAIIGGVALVSMQPKQAKPLLELLGSIQEVTMVVVRWAMFLAPLAVFGLITQITTRLGLDALLGMGLYVATVLSGLLVVMCMYLLILRLVRRQSPLFFLRAVRDAQLLAFSTSSSAAVMPLTLKTAEDKLGVRSSIAQFVIPLGTTVNMAGTALYQVVATLFLAQVFAVEVGLTSLLLIVVLAVGASVGSPGTPGIGIVILAMLLTSIGIPSAGIALIIGVDRILDMSRTAVNVTGDLVAATVMDRWVGGTLRARDQRQIERALESRREISGEDVITTGRVQAKPDGATTKVPG